MPGLNLADVRRVPVPLPSLEEQDEITRRVDALFALGSNLEHLYETAAARVERLTPSILDKAFRGELVPQDPNDEPASLLLGRIDSERDKPSSARKESRAASKQMPTAQRGRS
jgi:type I restriction enzyme S subunit